MQKKKTNNSVLVSRKVKTALNAGHIRLELAKVAKGRLFRSVVAIGRDGLTTALSQRLNLRERPCPAEIAAAYSIFAPFEGYQLCQKTNSYRLKGLVERKIEAYVSNGAAIVAAVLAGFDLSFDESPNATVYVPVRLLRELGDWTHRKPTDNRDPIVSVYEKPTGSIDQAEAIAKV